MSSVSPVQNKEQPLVQILMAVYNGEKYLGEQIASIQNQTYKNWELLVSDDESSDASLEVIKAYASKDSRIKIVLAGKHYGSAKKHFFALTECATASYAMFCDQDDVWDSNKVELTLNAMRQAEENGNKPILVATDLRVVDEDLNLTSPSLKQHAGMTAARTTFGYFLSSALVTGCTAMVNRSLLDLVIIPKNDSVVMMHDWWLALLASGFGSVIYLDQQTISYRQHGDNSVGAYRPNLKHLIKEIKAKRRTENKTLAQAALFKELYYKNLPKKIANQLDAYLRIPKAGVIERIRLLRIANVWRDSFIQNVLTVYIFLTINKDN